MVELHGKTSEVVEGVEIIASRLRKYLVHEDVLPFYESNVCLFM